MRLARDAWVVRAELVHGPIAPAIAPAIDELRRLQRSLESIRQLAGPSPRLLPRLEQRLVMAKQQLAAITPPAELAARRTSSSPRRFRWRGAPRPPGGTRYHQET